MASFSEYSQPNQSLIFFDWDDTLFPTTEMHCRRGLDKAGFENLMQCDPEFRASVDDWRLALRLYLEEATDLSSQVVIISNSTSPWIENCIENYGLDLHHLISGNKIKIVYAPERLKKTKRLRSQCRDARPVMHRIWSEKMTPEEHTSEQTMSKYYAMKDEVTAFYSKYKGQTWKNILSIGDMEYERNALNEVSFRRNPPYKERLRTKTILWPTGPSLTEITLRLRFSCLMLPAYVHFDGDFDLNLDTADDPLRAIAEGLHLPRLVDVPYPRHAWGKVPLQGDEQSSLANSLVDIAEIVDDAVHFGTGGICYTS